MLPVTMPRVVQRPSPNYSPVAIRHDLFVFHDEEGEDAGSRAWLCDPRAQAAPHLAMNDDGSVLYQLVPLQFKAWAQCGFNSAGISLEMPGFVAKGFPEARLQAAALIGAWHCIAYGIPPVWAQEGKGRGICCHHDLGAARGGNLYRERDRILQRRRKPSALIAGSWHVVRCGKPSSICRAEKVRIVKQSTTRLLSLLILLSTAVAAVAGTPGQDLLTELGGGGSPVAASLNFTKGNTAQFQSNVTYSGPSLRTITDATGAITYAPNNLLLYSNTPTSGSWSYTNISISYGTNDPFGGTSAFTLTANQNSVYFFSTSPNQELNNAKAVVALWIKRRNGSGTITLRTNATGPTDTPISITNQWQQVYVNCSNGNGSQNYWVLSMATSGDQIDIYAPTLSEVTYETAPRSGDQVITTSAAYYGPAFDYAPAWVAGSSPQLRIEGARTNLFVNTASPATQTITVANASAYANSFYGTGTVTLSGALTQVMTGTAGARTIYAGTTASTSLVATVAGLSATSYPQVELGAFATSTIPQAGSPTARAADSLTSTGALSTALAAGPWAYTWTSEATLTTSCVTGAAGAFTWPSFGWIKSLKVYKPGTPSAKVTC